MKFFFNDTAAAEIYSPSRHDALPIYPLLEPVHERGHARDLGAAERSDDPALADPGREVAREVGGFGGADQQPLDRKSTRLNSSHANISNAVFYMEKKRNSRGRQAQNG